MKRIDAIIRREQFSKVKAVMEKLSCPGMMVFTFRGHGKQGGLTESYKGRRFKVDLLPKVLLTIFVNDPDADRLVQAIARAARTGKIGDGKIFVASVENALRIRTGEQGQVAI